LGARLANIIFGNAPGVVLATSEALANVELEFDEGTTAAEQAELLEDFLVDMGVGDISDAFHRLRIHLDLGEYFAYPYAVPAREFGLVGRTISGQQIFDGDSVWPCAASLPMGFSWSLFFCQRQAEQRLAALDILADSKIINDRAGTAVYRPRDYFGDAASSAPRIRFHYAYVDNLGCLDPKMRDVESFVQDVQKDFGDVGLDIHETEILEGGGITLGTEVDGRNFRTTVSDKRRHRLRSGLLAMLTRRTVSGRQVEAIVGHCTFCGLIERGSLSCFHAVYLFRHAHYEERVRLWESVRQELKAFRGLLLILNANWLA
jgi:hypothetical protein